MAGIITNRTTRSRLQQTLSGFSSDKREDLIKAIGFFVGGEDGSILTATGAESTLVLVASLDDLPTPDQNGAIQLLDNYTYEFTKSVDLQGNYLVGGQNTVIRGASSENTILSSTGLGPSTALLQSEWTIPAQNISFSALRVLDLDANGNSTQGLDWFAVNFLDCPTIGTIRNYSNVILQTCAMLNSGGLTFDGTIGTIGFSQNLFDTDPGNTAIILPATLTVTRRFRIIYSAFVTLSGETGINASTSATIPTEGYILDTVNFGGGGTYVTGIPYTDNKALFVNNKGIGNSATTSHYTMNGNATATTITNTSTPVKIAGTTTSQSITQKFTNTDNRATYTGDVVRSFEVTAIVSCTSGNNNQVGLYIAKNGTVIPSSETYITTSGSGRAEGGVVQTIVELSNGDFIEIFTENITAINSITVTELSVVIKAIN